MTEPRVDGLATWESRTRAGNRHRAARCRLVTLVVAGALSMTSLVAAPWAHADASATIKARTQKMSDANLNSAQDGWYNPGDHVTLVCSKRGQAVQGFFSFNIPGGWDNLWYQTSDGHFVADVDIETGTLDVVAPECGTGEASADAPPSGPQGESIQGQIGCINSASPVGVWVEAQNSTSGWAAHEVPIELGGLSKVNYSYTLDRGGAYSVHVGCGGTPERWATDLRSDFVSGSRDFLCNDMNWIQGAAWDVIKGRVFGAFGPNAKKLTQNVPYGKCNAT